MRAQVYLFVFLFALPLWVLAIAPGMKTVVTQVELNTLIHD